MSAKPALIISHRCHAEFGAALAAAVTRLKLPHDIVALPADKDARLSEADVARAEIAFFSQDLNPTHSRQFFSAVRKAPNFKWLHVFNIGVDHPIYTEMLERGVRVTTSAGTTAQPISQTALTAMLMLARGFPHWLKAQAEHRWDPVRLQNPPRDLPGQTVLVYGMGQIGTEFARLSRALSLHVIGVRRSARKADDPVDEMHTPDQLDRLLPRADWLMLCCPLTAETRKLLSAQRLSLLPKGAYVLNVARGEVIDEAAMIAALKSGHLAGAYLDVFEQEPLPAASPLWDLPNVIVTPHNSTSSSGNEQRVLDCFVHILEQ
ncbi:MAG: D-2-hydroxyacid dehydrogenase [Betaproteobacteria bacterium]|nr:D-2-hydroxyacid dehydrogenase [Betaproteobacteria bacterium]